MNNSSFLELSDLLFGSYENIRLEDFPQRHFSPEHFHQTIDRLLKQSSNIFHIKEIGKSFEGRPIRLVTAGTGTTRVLLWSQMHGDESTATMAIADILNYLPTSGNDDPVRQILSSLSIHFLPMLNPDGAERTQRRTAQLIDMNRDALAL